MAKRSENIANVAAEEYYEAPRRSLAWLWALLAVVLIGLVVAVLHMSGALKGPEEALYKATKDTPVINVFTGALHEEAQELSPEQAVSVKDLRNNVIRAETDIKGIKEDIKKLDEMSKQMEQLQKDIAKIEKSLNELAYLGFEDAGAGQAIAAPAPAQQAAAAAPAATAAGGTAARATAAAAQGNYRLVGKIFEEIDADTIVDILNNMSDDEKVSILGALEEDTVAEILSAFDPVKSAELTRMIAAGE